MASICQKANQETLAHGSPPTPELGPDPDPQNILRSTCISCPPDHYGFTHSSLLATLSSIFIPDIYTHAVEHKCWRRATQEQLNALQENHTWDVISCPSYIKPIGCKWVLCFKLKKDGSLDRYKARLVAFGNQQKVGIGYDKMFAPIAKITMVRILLALAAAQS